MANRRVCRQCPLAQVCRRGRKSARRRPLNAQRIRCRATLAASGVGAHQLCVAGGRGLVEIKASAGQQAFAQATVFVHREAMPRRQRQHEMVGVIQFHGLRMRDLRCVCQGKPWGAKSANRSVSRLNAGFECLIFITAVDGLCVAGCSDTTHRSFSVCCVGPTFHYRAGHLVKYLSSKEGRYGNWYCEVVQRCEGLWIHYS